MTRFLARRGLRLTERGRFAAQAALLVLLMVAAVVATSDAYLTWSGWEQIPH